ncbi:MAG: hypothetical protein EZS28_026314 [Streblomastix strix]|uniref:Uncharacterized protein n=1 Tax=Streblomastix strix TaxID=222440 RepID=A0A5J4V7G2_9EUKA|nr:MAG: hypothetical protein EZS28_026314 [Streblomastix strix]
MPFHVEQQEFSAMCLFKDIYDKSSAEQVAVSGQLNLFDCEFQGTYILDNYANSTNANESASMSSSNPPAAEALPEENESFIDEVIIKHQKHQGSSPQPQYIITNVYIQVCVINQYFKSKGLQGRTQEAGRIPDAVVPADGKRPQESILMNSADVFTYCVSGMYYL